MAPRETNVDIQLSKTSGVQSKIGAKADSLMDPQWLALGHR